MYPYITFSDDIKWNKDKVSAAIYILSSSLYKCFFHYEKKFNFEKKSTKEHKLLNYILIMRANNAPYNKTSFFRHDFYYICNNILVINDYTNNENKNYLSLDNDIIEKINKFDNYKLSVKELKQNNDRIKECLLKNILKESYKLEIIDPIFYKEVFKNNSFRNNIKNNKYWKGLLDIIELYCKYRNESKILYIYIKNPQTNSSSSLVTVKQNMKKLKLLLNDTISNNNNISKIQIHIEICKDVEHQRLWHFYKKWHSKENEYVINTNYGLDLFTEDFQSDKKMINIMKLNPDLDFNIDKYEMEDLTIKLKF